MCGKILNVKCTVIGQARYHFTCNTFVQKINVTYTYKCSYTFFFNVLLTLFVFYKTVISRVDCHCEKQLNILTSVAHTMTKILYILMALAKFLT